VTPLINVFVV